ncbi:hypothetical protein PWT90_02666 [Aphanocladium album]|nr:hypothetical protein PWT90_02666 [Aphanocladium album]
MLQNILSFVLCLTGWYLFRVWTNQEVRYPPIEKCAKIVNITSCRRESYDSVRRHCRQNPTLEYLGTDLRNYHDNWEWARIYTVHWAEADINFPVQLIWNITTETIANIDLNINETSVDVSFEHLAVVFAEGRTSESCNSDDIRKLAEDHDPDNRLLIIQQSKPDAHFFGPRFQLVDKRAKFTRKLDDGINNVASKAKTEDRETWGSKLAFQRQRQKPEGIETEAMTATISMTKEPTPEATGAQEL